MTGPPTFPGDRPDRMTRLERRVATLEHEYALRVYVAARFDQVDAQFNGISNQITQLQAAVLEAISQLEQRIEAIEASQ